MRRSWVLTIVFLILAAAVPALRGQEQPIDMTAGSARVHRGANGLALFPGQASADGTVAGFLRSQGRGEAAVLALVPVSEASGSAGLTHVLFEQQLAGLVVHGAYVKAAFNSGGELVHLIELLAEPPASGLLPATVTPRRALDAVVNLYYPGRAAGLAEAGREGNTTEFSHDGFFFQNPKVTRVAIPMTNGVIHEGFLVETWTYQDNLLHHTLVDRNGRIVSSELRTNTDRYNVFLEHPVINLGSGNIGTAQSTEAGPDEDGVSGNAESPNGWISADGQSGGAQRTFRISGNNTDTYLDADANNGPDSGGTTVTTGDFLTTANLSQDPGTNQNKEVAVQNLFYTCNIAHDKLYKHGFTEPFRNFQENNFGKGGSGSDSVLCEAQDGSGLNNANFATPSDGSNPRMQMFLWDQSNPRRDGDVDSDIVLHEYGHGLTWRMIGSMSGCMSGAIGEGASDALAILMNGDDVVAEYSYNNVKGIRRYPYTNYPLTYGDLSGGSVHANGELYGAIVWKLRELFHANGVSDDELFDHFVGGMKFTPAGPAYEHMRDGILGYAAGVGTGRQCLVWQAFAEYGVGEGASGSCSSRGFFNASWNVSESFSLPAECQWEPEPNDPPTANAGGPYSGTEDAAVLFNGSGSSDPDGDTLSYEWDFGDGSTGSGATPSHTYLWGGTFTVTLTVSDGKGGSDSASSTATIGEVNDAPVASPGGPYNGVVGTAINFDGSGSSDFDNQDGTEANDKTLTYTWNFGDGNSGSGVSPSHTYGSADTYVVTLTVSDGVTSHQAQTSAVVEEQSTGGSTHVGDLDGASTSQGNSWTALVTITVHDGSHNPRSGAAVSGTWSGAASGAGSCTTNGSGQCVVSVSGIHKRNGSVTLTVNTLDGVPPSGNHDVDGDSNGTSITVSKP